MNSANALRSVAPATLAPTPGLVIANAANPTAKPLFCLFTQDWITMQTFIVQTLQLPVAVGDFQTKYGAFKDENEVTQCVAAMQSIQGLSTSFGDPLSLIRLLATDPTILQSKTAPPQLYVHIVWFATKLYQTANTFTQTFSQFREVLASVTPDERPALLKEILTGDGGLQSSAQAMVVLANDLVKSLADFQVKLTPATRTMANYTASSSTFYQDVVTAVGADAAQVTAFQDAADAAFKLWRDLTISAVATSVGTLVLSGGLAWPVSVGLAGGLGDAAKKARDAYNDACNARDTALADEQKKIALQNDLGAFNLQMGPVNDAVQRFSKALGEVAGVWLNISSQLDYIATTFTPGSLDNLPVVMEAMKLDLATKDWQIIATAASDYTANSLVSYQITNFGDRVPDAA